MKTLVAYMSKTGNTRKIAEAMFKEIDEEKELRSIDEVKSIEGYDLVFLGFPINRMGPNKKAKEFLELHCVNGRNVVLFITHAAPEDNPDLPPMLEKFKTAARGANIFDVFDCQGELARGVKRIMSLMPDAKLRQWAKADNSQGQPDQARIARAHAFAKNVMQRFHDTCEASKTGRQKVHREELLLSRV